MGKIRVNRWIIENQCWFEDIPAFVMVVVMVIMFGILITESFAILGKLPA